MSGRTWPSWVLTVLLLAGAGGIAQNSAGIRVQGTRPDLVFASDAPDAKLGAVFSNETISTLRDLRAGVALMTIDFSPARAELVRKLNHDEIPVIAWIALPKAEGYYLNADNAPQAATRLDEFYRWTATNHLKWEAVGLDIEPNFTRLAALRRHKLRMIASLGHRLFDGARVRRARQAYSALIRQIQAHGYPVQTYQLQFLSDERKVHSTMLERVLGVVDVRGDDEVFMLYTSFNHALDSALIWEYGPDAQTIAVGSTAGSGNPAIDAKYGPLNWEEFRRDLIVASHFSHTVGVYSLEGCLQQGFLPRLKTLDWSAPVVIPPNALKKASRLRRVVQGVLWFGSHFVYFALALVAALAWLIWWRRRRIHARRSPTVALSHGRGSK